MKIDRFTSGEIKPLQGYIYLVGVRKWMKRIKEGSRPRITLKMRKFWDHPVLVPQIQNGHHRLEAYRRLGFKSVPIQWKKA